MAQLKDLLVNGSARVIGSLFANLSGNVLNFGICSTAAGTAAKTVTTGGTFELIEGSKVLVLFQNTDTSNAPTLNVNGTGAKSIKVNASDGIGKGFLAAQQYYWFIYDGTNWRTAGAGITQIIPTQYGGTGNSSFTANRVIYSNTATKLASGSITTDGAYLGNISYLSVNNAHQTNYRLYVNGNSLITGSLLAVGGTSTAIHSSVTSGTTSQIQIIAGAGGNTNASIIGFHNPNVSSASFGYYQLDANTGLFKYRSDDTYWYITTGTVKLDNSWRAGDFVVGTDGADKVVIGYLASNTNGVVVGAHNSALSNWSTLNISGTRVNIRQEQTIIAGFIDGCLNIYPQNGSYREGIRIHPVNSWSDITLQGNANSGNTSSVSTEDWFIGNNNGNFYITRYGSVTSSADAQRSEFSSVGNQWRLRGFVQAHKAGIYRSGLHIYGPTYGNTASDLVSGTAGVYRWNDGGPQITFDTSPTPGGSQAAAIIFTDHDAGSVNPGASFHFVTNQNDDNQGGNLSVTAPILRARKRLAVGQNEDNSSYNLYVNGTSYFTETITGDIISAWHLLAGRPSNTTNFRTYFETVANLHHDDPARTDCEVSYNRWFANNSDQTNYSPAKLNLPVVDQHVLSFGIDNFAVYSRHIAFDIRSNAVYVGARNNNTWSNWEQLVRNTGTWNISITGNANTVDNLHASDFVRAYNTTNDNIDSDWGQSIKTFDPIPSGTPPEQNPNITLLSLGNSFARRKELAFTYSNNNIYYRRRTDNTFSNWVKLIHSGNYTDYTVTKTGSGATGTWNISVTGTATRLATFKVTTNDNNNASGYFLVYTWTISTWSNYRMSFIVTSRHSGGGLVTISCGNNTNTLSQANAYAEIYYWGPISSGSIISADAWQIYVSADGSKAYLFARYSDYNEAVITPLSADAPSKSTWMTSINTATYGTLKANTNYNTVRPLAKKLTIKANGTQKGQFNNSADVTVNLGNVAQDFTGANSGNANNINADTFAGMTRQQWLNTVYPIGSIYMSVSATSPATLFGGTWESLGGRFLIGQNGTYTAGSTGGSTTHTHTTPATTTGGTAITVAQMPSHQHAITKQVDNNSGNHISVGSGGAAVFYKTDNSTLTRATGGGQAHTHSQVATTTSAASTLPPYLAVYMWKRTA